MHDQVLVSCMAHPEPVIPDSSRLQMRLEDTVSQPLPLLCILDVVVTTTPMQQLKCGWGTAGCVCAGQAESPAQWL